MPCADGEVEWISVAMDATVADIRFVGLTIVVISSKHVLLSLTVTKLGQFCNTICHLWQPYWISSSYNGVRGQIWCLLNSLLLKTWV